MKIKVFFVQLFLLAIHLNLFSQTQIYFGYPIGNHVIKDGDKIILNPLPINPQGTFDTTINMYIDQLKEFCLYNTDYQVNIYIHDYQPDSNYCLTSSIYKRKKLVDYFMTADSTFYLSNVLSIIPVGKREPLISTKPENMSFITYNYINSRIEIEFVLRKG